MERSFKLGRDSRKLAALSSVAITPSNL
ncbi:hypothetical protein MED222_06035 [Vibrio sp. MED222]|nr:hypothetical protein MED222_06035 [Vibrio sp. MED222]